MEKIIVGIFLVTLGLIYFAAGIDSRIPKPDKGCKFIFAQDGYTIKKTELAGTHYEKKENTKVYVLTMEKIGQEDTPDGKE